MFRLQVSAFGGGAKWAAPAKRLALGPARIKQIGPKATKLQGLSAADIQQL